MKTWKKWTYGSGNFANTVVQQVFNNRIQFFYIDVVGLNAALAGIIWFIFGLWNAVNDPLMGNISDRTRSRLGRRIPYILFGAIPLGLSFFFLWTPPRSSAVLTAGYFFIFLFLYDTIYTLVIMAYNSLFTELATDLKERSGLAAVREGLAVIALLLAFVLAPILSEELGFVTMGIVIGAFTSIGYLISVIGAQEDPAHMKGESMPMLQSLKICLANHPFRWYIVANLAKEYLFVVLPATLPFWRKYALNIQGEAEVFGTVMGAGDQEAILLALPFLLCVPLLAIWNRLTPRIGVRRAWIYSFLLFIPGLLIIMLANDFYTGLVGTTLIAPGLAGFMMLPIVMLTDVIDHDARQVGERREGIFFGINGGIVKLAFSFQGILYSIVFTITGFVAGADVQSASAVWGIRFMMGGSPILALLLGIWALRNYPLRHADKEARAAVPAV
ncbi:MAG: MFS transporter [Anaerolineae bacterium]|nr:MFS transporter [Anaerolineae bacterium]